ncbi:tripartite tricarboxylate transporter permease [Desulforhopalus sp. IMCC35007]|uniref:tripartite tricarboxylate transporter permease n=1 Tax=Desulforhopalus sp. IMCC35007 TaxID=2569543 RepID=UPI0010AEDFCD|nr:tripartite tricarboxylate transporter permease [Desulforhopalus sp. IMCC35007]TKB09269.1 C4-dicarboxylate ABC transporter permease [Desulforhopalus sp. IMCC35007]
MIIEALQALAHPVSLLAVFIGTAAGVLVGGMPGLTATMAVALLIPVTFVLEPLTGLILMGGVYCGAMYGGSIPAILLRTPGTPAAVATAIEGYPMSQQGHGGLALKVSVISSFCGGTFSALVLLLVAPVLATFALTFGPPEYFLLGILGLVGIVSMADDENKLVKALISGLLGLIIALVGTDPISGMLRYTMNLTDLFDGIAFMPALIGLFSISQMLELSGTKNIVADTSTLQKIKREPFPKGLKKFIGLGSITGTVVGILPGEGATIAAFLSYNFARQRSKNKHLFGKGNPEGIAAAEAGNNGCVGGSLIPTLTLGIPGNSIAAALMGGLLVHGLIPGPELFTKYGVMTYAFIMSLFLANIVFLVMGLLMAPYFAKISLTPPALLIPVVCLFSILGSYAMNNSILDVFIALICGIAAVFLHKTGFSLGALILGLILGPIAETGFAQALIMGHGSYAIFFNRPQAIALWVIIILLLVPPVLQIARQHRRDSHLETPKE